MILLIKLLLAFSCGLIDRLRGTGDVDVFYSKSVESVIYGLFIGTLFLQVWWHVLLFACLWAIGGSFGWGEPLGALMRDKQMNPDKYEWWQFWKFKESPILACILRGIMWGACVLPVAYFDTKASVFVFAMGLIFPAAIKLAVKFPYVMTETWGRQEFYRGWLVGTVALLLSLY